MDLPEGIHRLSLPIPGNVMGTVNAYVIRDAQGCALIDCGWDTAETLAAVEQQLGALGLRLDSIHTLVITHGHADHSGLAPTLVDRYHPRLMMHRLDWLHARRDPSSNGGPASGSLAWLELNGLPVHDLTQSEMMALELRANPAPPPPDVELDGGEVLRIGEYSLEVVWTPGHTVGHICLHDVAHGLLVAGDHVLDNVTPIVAYSQGFENNPMGSMQDSLRKVAALEATLVLPGHGQPFTGLRRRAEKLLEHHAWRERLVVETLARIGPATAAEIAEHVPWSARRSSFRELGITRRRVALGQIIAHLEKLRSEGAISSDLLDSHVQYRLLPR